MTYTILFDGLCNICNSYINFILKRDSQEIFNYATLQSEIGFKLCEQHNIDTNKIDSIVLIKDESTYIKSSAVLEILKNLPIGWRLFRIGIILPIFIRDWIYDTIAKHRYNTFGKKDECPIPPKNVQDRFLG